MRNLAVFASGSGTNADNISTYFKDSDICRVRLIVTDNPQAGVLAKAAAHGIEALVVPRETFRSGEGLTELINGRGIDYIVLAGFLRLLPASFIDSFRGRIINIHPALLPDYGGKGMYGDNVHRAVIEAGEKYSGITIHHVTEEYDSGDIIEQHRLEVYPDDTAQTLAARIHRLEYRYFPEAIEKEILRIFDKTE